jgi:hypothetical protein
MTAPARAVYHPCETCGVLTNLLLVVTDKLIVVTTRLAALAGGRDHASFDAAKVEAQTLREEDERIRGELERHRVDHHSNDWQ